MHRPASHPSRPLLALAACALAFAARADLPAGSHLYELKSGSVTYTVVHKLHEVKGTSTKLEGRALVLADGSARVEVRAPIASFDSGNGNRDAHMREAAHELQHPTVTLKGKLAGVQLPLGAPVDATLDAMLDLNGERKPVSVPVKLSQDGARVKATFSFTFSLDAFKIDRPELLLMKVDDNAKMDGELSFEEPK